VSYTVLDQTTGVTMILPISSSAYSAQNLADTYAVRVNGYDWQGLAISSAYENVPVAAK
jgi:Gpi18-like mannosyltransferase